MNIRVLVLYYSTCGHVEALARAVQHGAAIDADVEVTLKRVPELMPRDVVRAAGAKLDQEAPLATPVELADYDAIIFGTPTRFGMMASQMRNFLDQTGGLWAKNALVGKIGSVFTSTSNAARWPGIHHFVVPYHAAASRSSSECRTRWTH